MTMAGTMPSGRAGYAAPVSAILALLSALTWGTSDFFGGLLSKRHPVIAVVGASQIIGFVAVSLVVVVTGGAHSEAAASLAWLPWSAGAAVCGIGGLLCFYQALSTGTMGVVAPITGLGVVVPVILGLVRGDTLQVLTVVGIVVAIVGVVLASGPELSGAVGARPVVLAAGAAVLFGLALFMIDGGSRTSTLMTVWGMRATSFVIFTIVAMATRSVGGLTTRDLPFLTLIGCGDLAANALFGVASSMSQVSVAAVLGSLYPVVTVILARLVLHERLRRIQQVGVALSLAGAALIAV